MRHISQQESEFVRLFEAFRSPVYAFIQTITRDEYAAEELTQTIFLKLWQKKDSWNSIDNMDHYIRRMAHNACKDWFKKLSLDARRAGEIKKRLQTEYNNVADHADYLETRQMLEDALAMLSPQRRRVFELSRNEGLKLEEIAEVMHISYSTVNHHLRAAISHVRSYHAKHTAIIILLIIILR
ncbi:MAG: sigma-70 family RNA polymerase sigma factor [Agriterribacter sp.]